MKKNIYRNKKTKVVSSKNLGITLIALVITIVVLLILASVSITAIFGDNGLLKLAKEAAEKTNEAVQKDKQDVQNMVTDIDDIINPPVDVSKLTKIVTENTKAIDKNGNKLIIPAGFKVLADTEENNVEYEDSANPTVEDGIVIADSIGNEFVWVPVFDETPIYTTHNGKNIGLLYDFGSYDDLQKKYVAKNPVTTIEWSDNGCREPDTVKTHFHDNGTEHKGDDNEDNLNIVLEGEEKTEEKFKEQLQREFDYLVASIKKYKGFYIGRYETGNLQSDKENTPVVQKGRTDISYVNWYYIYQTSKNISLKNTDEKVQKSVTSSMIWGSQWDAVMNWFLKDEKTKEYVADSTGMGWYEKEKRATGTPITGENEEVKNRVKNIYDMAGNVWDWTLEINGYEHRIARGGSYNYPNYCSPGSIGGFQSDAPFFDNGSRATLIVNL